MNRARQVPDRHMRRVTPNVATMDRVLSCVSGNIGWFSWADVRFNPATTRQIRGVCSLEASYTNDSNGMMRETPEGILLAGEDLS